MWHSRASRSGNEQMMLRFALTVGSTVQRITVLKLATNHSLGLHTFVRKSIIPILVHTKHSHQHNGSFMQQEPVSLFLHSLWIIIKKRGSLYITFCYCSANLQRNWDVSSSYYPTIRANFSSHSLSEQTCCWYCNICHHHGRHWRSYGHCARGTFHDLYHDLFSVSSSPVE